MQLATETSSTGMEGPEPHQGSTLAHNPDVPGLCAGPAAIHYFEEAFPEVTPFGSKGLYHNKAEWIVDLTTKVRRPLLCM